MESEDRFLPRGMGADNNIWERIMPIDVETAIIMANALGEDLTSLFSACAKTGTIKTEALDTVKFRLNVVRQMVPRDDKWTRILGNLQQSITRLEKYETISLGERAPLIDLSKPLGGMTLTPAFPLLLGKEP